ncbi:hypothetical protein AJ79_09318 [Helicocarpus griseus UAMH5409]|uniref:Fungal-type protein kinase domain-containing protein n=1 Tax=Helicocarpus griseus UAMH5409 TaxID=1447875 RepID=A0A2B7WKY9_9EURO|nr:hypothetical protein AJ79_09318 [Helicocarpus griseus UAMH5409]
MGSSTYEPFRDAQEFSNLMPELFNLYWSYEPDAFSFDFLQRTKDFKVVCKDATAEKADFTTPPALERAIQNSARINSPDTSEYPWGPPVDDSWTGWMGITIDSLIEGVDISRGEEEFGGPLFSVLGAGLVVNGHRRVLGHRLFKHRPNHWTFMIRDHSPLDSKGKDGKNGKNCLLRSEIMGITSILYRQMNEIRWDLRKHKYMQPRLTYQDGTLTATIVTFMVGKVRVVQATCDPSNRYPTLTCTLRGLYNLSMSCYDKSSVHKIVKWILCPPKLAWEVPLRGKKA